MNALCVWYCIVDIRRYQVPYSSECEPAPNLPNAQPEPPTPNDFPVPSDQTSSPHTSTPQLPTYPSAHVGA
jgi:hypothetical protein